MGLIWAAVLSSFIDLFINSYFSAREIAYSTKEQLKDIFTYIFNLNHYGRDCIFVGKDITE